MPIRLRKFLGMIALIMLLIVYSLVAMRYGDIAMQGRPVWLQTIGWIILGIAWVPPAGLIVRWMVRP